MTENTERPQPEPQYLYNIDQKVSANAYFDADVDGEAVRFQVTTRHGATAEQIAATTKRLIEAYKLLRADFPKPEKPLPQQADEKREHPAPEDGGKKKWENKPVPFDELPPELQVGSAEGGPIEFFAEKFDKVLIEPQPDAKASVKFFRTGMKYPVGAPINKWKNQNVATMLQALGDIDPSEAQEINVAGVQYWKNGNERKNQDGSIGHWKDLCHVEKS